LLEAEWGARGLKIRYLKEKRLDVTIEDVSTAYSGPVGMLWELLMGEQIHVGGEDETSLLAEIGKITEHTCVLDVCSALGGPARQLARRFGCRVVGLDATPSMVAEAERRTDGEGLSSLVTFRLGNALDMPFHGGTFDLVWGQDAWCYITDKERLVREAFRVMKPGGRIVFTDWVQTGEMSDEEWFGLNGFMAFPYLESLPGYMDLMNDAGFSADGEDVSPDFTRWCSRYLVMLENDLQQQVKEMFGEEFYSVARNGLAQWVRAAEEGKVGRARLVGWKPETQ
jgi:ubiquinone/menaquinone biosynthesis C-methylase UbiE